MTMTSEELKIKVSLDTRGVDEGADRVKSKLKGIGDVAGNMSDATIEATGSVEALSTALTTLTGIRVAEVIGLDGEAIKQFTDNIRLSFKSAYYSIKEFNENAKNSFSKSFYNENIGDDFTLSGAFKDLSINIKSLGRDVKKLGSNLKTSFVEGHKAAEGLRKKIVALGVVMVPVAGIWSSFSASRLGSEITNTANRVGMSTAKYQEWMYILEQTGADITDLTGAQQTLTEAQLDVASGAEDIINAFKRIGLSAEEVLGMNRQELFEKTIAGLQNIENSTERAAVAYRLLSEDGSTLASLLAMSNEETRTLASNYQYLGAIMSKELIAKSVAFQGSLASLRAAFQGLTNTLAEIFLPIITKVVNALTWLIAVANMFLRTIFGLEITTSASGSNSSVGAGINGFEVMKDKIDEATGSAKELRRTLMGFDELNVLDGTKDSGGGASGAGASGGGIGDLGGGLSSIGGGLFNPDNLGLSGISEFVEKWKTEIQTIIPIATIVIGFLGMAWCLLTGNWVGFLFFAGVAGFGFASGASNGLWEGLAKKFEDLGLTIIPIAMVIGGAVGGVMAMLMGNWVLAGLLFAMAGIGLATITAGDGFSMETLKKVAEEIKNYALPIVLIAGAVVAAMTGHLAVAGALLVGAGLAGVLTWYGGGDMWEGLTKGIEELLPKLKKYAIPLIALAGAIAAALLGNFAVMAVLLAVAGISGAFTLAGDKGVWDEQTKPLKDVWDDVKKWFNTNVAPKFTKEYWSKKFNTIKEGASAKLGEVKTEIQNRWNHIAEYFKTNIGPKFTGKYWSDKFDPIKKGFADKMAETRTTLMNGWNNIKGYFNENIAPKFTKEYWNTKYNTFKDGLATKLSEAKTSISNGWTAIKNFYTTHIGPKFTVGFWKKKFDTVKEGGRQAFNGLISIVEKAINGIVSKLNTVKFTIPSWVPQVGGRKFGISLSQVKIPRLAEGGIATASTLANIGENGKEAVLPLENNTEWMDALADKIASRSQGPTKLVLKVGERELGWASINGINQITKQTGELQLVL